MRDLDGNILVNSPKLPLFRHLSPANFSKMRICRTLQPVKRVSQPIKALTATALLLVLSGSALPTPAPDYFRAPRGATLAVAQNTAQSAKKPKPERFTTGSSPALKSGTTPNVGSPEWKKEQAENERKEQRLKSIINSICRGC